MQPGGTRQQEGGGGAGQAAEAGRGGPREGAEWAREKNSKRREGRRESCTALPFAVCAQTISHPPSRRFFAHAHALLVGRKQDLRTRWEAGLERWRFLQVEHAVLLFRRFVLSDAFAPPTSRVAALRADQRATQAALLDKVAAAPRELVPFSGVAPPEAAKAWSDAALAEVGGFASAAGAACEALRAHEDGLEARASAELARTSDAVTYYAAFSVGGPGPSQVLEAQCGRLAAARRGQALALVARVADAARGQASAWSRVAGSLGGFLVGLCQLYSDHRARLVDLEARTQAELESQREAHAREDAGAEAAHDAAVSALQLAHDEASLDERLKASLLACLLACLLCFDFPSKARDAAAGEGRRRACGCWEGRFGRQ